MKNLFDVAEEYLEYLKYHLKELEEEKLDCCTIGEVSGLNLTKDLDDQIGHAKITIKMIDNILTDEYNKVDDPIPEVVVDIRRGLVEAVYSNTTANKVHLYLVDWDNIGCEREYLYCLPEYGDPNHIDNENWDIPHLLNLWRDRHMKALDKWDPIDDE